MINYTDADIKPGMLVITDMGNEQWYVTPGALCRVDFRDKQDPDAFGVTVLKAGETFSSSDPINPSDRIMILSMLFHFIDVTEEQYQRYCEEIDYWNYSLRTARAAYLLDQLKHTDKVYRIFEVKDE